MAGADMTAARLLKAARAAGIEFALDGTDLLLKAASKPPAEVLDAVSRHKAEILALLHPAQDGWSAEDWHAFFDKRAVLPSSMGGCHVQMPRPRHSRAASWNG